MVLLYAHLQVVSGFREVKVKTSQKEQNQKSMDGDCLSNQYNKEEKDMKMKEEVGDIHCVWNRSSNPELELFSGPINAFNS